MAEAESGVNGKLAQWKGGRKRTGVKAVVQFEDWGASGIIVSEAAFQAERSDLHTHRSLEWEIPRPAGEGAGLRNDAGNQWQTSN